MPAQSSILCHWLFHAQRLHLRSVILASNLPHWKRLGWPKWIHLFNGWHWLFYWGTCNRVPWRQITIASTLFKPSPLLKLHCYVLLCIFPFQYRLVILHCDVFGWNHNWRALQYYWSSHYNWYWKADQVNWRKYCRYFCPHLRYCSRLCSRISSSDWTIKWNLYVLHIFCGVHSCSSCAFSSFSDVMENIQRENK